MTTYHLSIYKDCGFNLGLETFSRKYITLQNEDEFFDVQELCQNRTNLSCFFKASVVPLRTDWEHLSRDLFLPCLMNGILKTKNVSSVCFVLLAIVWDIATLPIRLQTLLPRMLYNFRSKAHVHPLMTYLQRKGIDQFFREGEVNLAIYRQEKRQDGLYDRNGIEYALPLVSRETPFFRINERCQFNMTTALPTPVQ